MDYNNPEIQEQVKTQRNNELTKPIDNDSPTRPMSTNPIAFKSSQKKDKSRAIYPRSPAPVKSAINTKSRISPIPDKKQSTSKTVSKFLYQNK